MMEGLSRICTTLAELNERMEQERKVYLAEFEDRQRKGLRGDEAVRHYNQWMRRNDMEHLCVPE